MGRDADTARCRLVPCGRGGSPPKSPKEGRSREKVRGSKRQIGLTFSGTSLIAVSLITGITLYAISQSETSKSLDETAKAYRDGLMREVTEEIATLMNPVYRSVVRWRLRADSGLVQGDERWPPLLPNYQNDLQLLHDMAALLFNEFDPSTHVRSVQADGTGRTFQSFIATGAVLALKGSLTERASSPEECEAVGIVKLVPGPDDDVDSVTTVYQRIVNGTMLASHYPYDVDTALVLPEEAVDVEITSCHDAMAPLWDAPVIESNFANWTWYLSEAELGIDRQLHGSLPLYDSDDPDVVGEAAPTTMVGRMTSSLAVSAFQESLQRVLEKSGDWGKGGAFVLLTADGKVLAQTETSGDIASLDGSPLLRQAIDEIESSQGKTCPDDVVQLNADERLIDSAPYYAENFGMPPVPEGRWCVVMTIPRVNMYESIDEAELIAYVSGACVIVVTLGALALLTLAVLLGLKAKWRLQKEKLRADLHKVDTAIKEVRMLNCPMALISADQFLGLSRLEHYESLRDKGNLVILDKLDGPKGIQKFQEKNTIVFISHQWLGSRFPDTDAGEQLATMQAAVQRVALEGKQQKEVYVWVDYISIAQRHQKMRIAAVSALPLYASVADLFIVVAPPLFHVDSQKECNFETYKTRGWCRAEMLARVCGNGLKDVYLCDNTAGELQRLEDVTDFSLSVFQGDFTVATDPESLVRPLLGLYSVVLDQQDTGHMQRIYDEICQDKEAFFPRTYKNLSGEEVELFGQCRELVEAAKEG